MAGWAGFSDEELRRLQLKDQAVSTSAVGRGRRPTPSNRSRQQLQREEALQMAAQQKTGGGLSPGQKLAMPPPPEQKLAMPPPPEQKLAMPPPQPVKQPVATVKQVEAPVAAPREKVETVDVNHDPVPAEETTPIAKELGKQEAELREKSRMEILQEDQKLIEEKNKRKKALLAKTIAEKSKQTQAEAVKLKRIQKELQTLDDMVSNDIGILRAKIEEASWDYNSARKRYEKAETEYVTAKLDLHKKTEVKEQLTEHLYAIIQQNELRKASKLEELMQQLQLQTTEEEEPKKELQKKKEGVNGNTAEEKLQEAGAVVEQSVQDQVSVAGTQIKAEGDDTEGHKDCPSVSEPKTRDLDCKNADGAPKGQTEAPASAS